MNSRGRGRGSRFRGVGRFQEEYTQPVFEMSNRGRGGFRGVKRFREEYTEPVAEEKASLNKKTVFSDSDSDDSAPAPSKRQCTEQGQKYPRKMADEVLIVRQVNLQRQSQFWKNITIRGPFSDIWTTKVHHNRPLYNLLRLVFHKIHRNCIDYMRNDLPKMMGGSEVPDPKDLMDDMCEKVLRFEVDSQIYNFHVPHMMDYINRLFSKIFITLECDKCTELKNQLATLCHNKGVEVSAQLLEKVRNVLMRQFFSMASDLLTFVYETSSTGNIVEITGFRQFTFIPGNVFETFVADVKYRTILTSLGRVRSDYMTRKLPYSLIAMIACEESEQLLENVLEYALIQRLPEGMREFLTGWMTGVRKRVRKLLLSGKMQEIVKECFPGKKVPFTVTLKDKNLHGFLKKVVRKLLNSKSFTIFDGEWEETALEMIQTKKQTLAFPYVRFFEVSELINHTAKSALTALLTRSVADRAILYHTTAQLLRFVVYFICSTVRHVFHYDGRENVMYDGQIDEEFDGFDEFENYEQNPIIELPKAADVPTILELPVKQDGAPDIHPVQLKLFPAPAQVDSSVPPPRTFTDPSPVPEQKFTVKTEKKSFSEVQVPKTVKRSLLVKSEPGSEVTEEELSSARALRPASECASDPLRDEEIPQKWRDAYALTLEWNRDIRQQLDRIVKRYETMTRAK